MLKTNEGSLSQTPVDTSPLTPPGQPHRVQLDGIRAIAVLMVMVEHYFPETERWLEVGTVGVRVFFVLSGFLITGILLRARHDAEIDGISKATVLRNFYMRRFLRIFPLFYAVLLTTEILHFPPVRASFWWHFSYLSNILMFRMGTPFDSVTHLWSLAVEEQFYVIWPWLILYLPRRAILPAIILALATGPIFRAVILLTGDNAWQASVLTPACLDALGLGALLAMFAEEGLKTARQKTIRIFLFAGLPIFVISIIGGLVIPSAWWIVPFDLAIGLWGAGLIDGAFAGFAGKAGSFLSSAPLVYLGMISYGIYVLHNFVGGIAARFLRLIGLHNPPQFARAICMLLITVALASASWQWFEKPINRMKRLFPYRIAP